MLTEQGKAFTRSLRGSQTADQIVLVVNADQRTAAPIPLNQLGPLLRKVGLMTVLRTVAADASKPDVLRNGLAAFLDQLGDMRQTTLDTTDDQIAQQAAAVLNALAPIARAVGIPDVTPQIYALGGGVRYGRTDAAELAGLFALDDFERAKAHAINDQLQPALQAVVADLDALHQRVVAGETVQVPTPQQMAQRFAQAMGV